MKENKKRELVGIVVSDKADKTIIVKVETQKKDPLYMPYQYPVYLTLFSVSSTISSLLLECLALRKFLPTPFRDSL